MSRYRASVQPAPQPAPQVAPQPGLRCGAGCSALRSTLRRSLRRRSAPQVCGAGLRRRLRRRPAPQICRATAIGCAALACPCRNPPTSASQMPTGKLDPPAQGLELLQGTRHPPHCVRCVWRCMGNARARPFVHVEHSHHSLTHPCLPDAPAGLKDGRSLAPSTRAPRRRRQGSLSARDAGGVSSSGSRRFERGRALRRGASASHTRTLLSGKLHVMRACARVCWIYAMIYGWIHASRS